MTTSRTVKMLASKIAFLCLVASAQGAEPANDVASIRHVLMTTFDKPEARLAVDPVVMVGAHAVAGWAQGERGGRALLIRRGTEWHITLCAGDGLKQATVLHEAGLSQLDAQALAQALAAAEARLTAAQRARFSTFDGVVRMDAAGQHPPSHRH